jgi:hypothetical protein
MPIVIKIRFIAASKVEGKTSTVRSGSAAARGACGGARWRRREGAPAVRCRVRRR